MTLAVNQFFSILTILSQVILVVLVVWLLGGRRFLKLELISKYALVWGLIVAFAATAGSLIYSEVLGYEPCKLCWLQRIFMYPQLIILGMALIAKDRKVFKYIMGLSIMGGILAAYHYVLQLGVNTGLPCSAVGYSASCSQNFVLQYGYITIPMMALSAFALNLVISLIVRKDKS